MTCSFNYINLLRNLGEANEDKDDTEKSEEKDNIHRSEDAASEVFENQTGI